MIDSSRENRQSHAHSPWYFLISMQHVEQIQTGKLCPISQSCDGRKPHETHCSDWSSRCLHRHLALTASASARLGIAPLAAQDDAVIQVKGGHGHGHGQCTAAAAVTIMDGAGAAGTITAGAIIVTTDTRFLAGDCFRRPIAPTKAGTCIWTVAPIGATSSVFRSVEACQPRSISTAIRIRSEWFLAPSFCLSSEVVLATVL